MDGRTSEAKQTTAKGSREQALSLALESYDSGRFLNRLSLLVAERTESQIPEGLPALERYCVEVLAPWMEELGFACKLLPNPEAGRGPALLASRIEDPALPTLLIYGHGDVTLGQAGEWRDEIDPWQVTLVGERVYGRGTADNKGQHLIAIEALAAVLAARGRLGFNAKLFVETGEEVGSPGLRGMLRAYREDCAADVFIGLDGPRMAADAPEVVLGARGAAALDLRVKLRDGAHHSGHWGGVLADPAVLLAHAIAATISPEGRILVPGWQVEEVADSVTQACRRVRLAESPEPQAENWWGEQELTRAERIFTRTGAIVLATLSGKPEAPGSAVQGEARARIQLRHTVDRQRADFAPALRARLAAKGLDQVEVIEANGEDSFPASRTDPDDPWVKRVAASLALTSGKETAVIPNSSGSNPSALFQEELGTPVIWIPHSYPGCGQHGPDEHALAPLLREGLELMAGVFWDLGEERG